MKVVFSTLFPYPRSTQSNPMVLEAAWCQPSVPSKLSMRAALSRLGQHMAVVVETGEYPTGPYQRRDSGRQHSQFHPGTLSIQCVWQTQRDGTRQCFPPSKSWLQTNICAFVCFIFIVFFPLPFSPLTLPPLQQSPHCCPCPWVPFPFCSVPPLPNLSLPHSCQPALSLWICLHFAC